MLTKDLIRVRKISNRIRPQFIKVEDPVLQNFAKELIAVYEEQLHCPRTEIEELITPLVQAKKDVKLHKGLNKILQDRCEFSHTSEINFPEQRKLLFEKAAELLKQGELTSPDCYRDKVLGESALDHEFISDGIYSDLPENEKLVKLKKIFPRELLERYNVALVQSLLLSADRIEIEIIEHEPAKLRNFFKYLKFYRLLAEIKLAKGKKIDKSKIKLMIDGPASLFENTQKYGLQLACFFPAVCLLSKWELKSNIKVDNKEYKLVLDQDNKLVCHYANFSNYIPEEIQMFERYFQSKSKEWIVADDINFLNLGQQQVVFPDFSFKNKNGSLIHLELFHRWHVTQLMQRLEQCENNPELPVIIGVDRVLYNKPEFKERLKGSSWFDNNGFLFKDFPGVEKVVKLLRRKSGEQDDMLQMDFKID